ncbi:hypothetical protein [Helicovermis profundi]|uniref:Uncharacterized protein n=1 Tax=Helicovermis profundi TaxID=3065157 RepID=A0AAU9E381_9FIRM|nr:hypothetical protein HLPR_13500 [Clostridia bacterium S502]
MKEISFVCKDNFILDSKIERIEIDKNIVLKITIEPKNINRIIEREYFNLFKDSILEPAFTTFNSKNEIEITTMLDPDLKELLEMAIDDINENTILDYLVDKNKNQKNDIFLNSESWYILDVKQEEILPDFLKEKGSIKTGFNTKWLEELN